MKYTLFTAFTACILAASVSPAAFAAGTYAPATLGSFYGYLVCDTDDSTPGLYKVNADGSGKRLWHYELAPAEARCGMDQRRRTAMYHFLHGEK